MTNLSLISSQFSVCKEIFWYLWVLKLVQSVLETPNQIRNSTMQTFRTCLNWIRVISWKLKCEVKLMCPKVLTDGNIGNIGICHLEEKYKAEEKKKEDIVRYGRKRKKSKLHRWIYVRKTWRIKKIPFCEKVQARNLKSRFVCRDFWVAEALKRSRGVAPPRTLLLSVTQVFL